MSFASSEQFEGYPNPNQSFPVRGQRLGCRVWLSASWRSQDRVQPPAWDRRRSSVGFWKRVASDGNIILKGWSYSARIISNY